MECSKQSNIFGSLYILSELGIFFFSLFFFFNSLSLQVFLYKSRAPVTSGIVNCGVHPHIRLISVSRPLHFNRFSVAFADVFPSNFSSPSSSSCCYYYHHQY